jgi:stage II sporulation protein AA (anti-sigma F factor antagonist)
MQDDILRVDVSHVDGITWLTVHGEIDANSVLDLRAPLDHLDCETHVFVDMTGVRFMDSTGLNVLLAQHMRMDDSGGSIHVCNPSEAVRRVFEVTGLCDTFFKPEPLPSTISA